MVDERRSSDNVVQRKLEASHWAVLRAFELGDFHLHRLDRDIADLHEMGLLHMSDGNWHLTDDGRTLIALRRHL